MDPESLRVTSDFPCGNVADATIADSGSAIEASFAAHPHGGPECLWFFFRIAAGQEHADRPLHLTLKHTENMLGASALEAMRPVVQQPGEDWWRLESGEVRLLPDGRRWIKWELPCVAAWTDVAFCYPYGMCHLTTLRDGTGDAWAADTIGVSQQGRPIARLSNAYGEPDDARLGLYLIARQHSGETPGSWVLDGVLRAMAELGDAAPLVWAVPLSNIDGVEQGGYGKDNFPYDLNRAWGQPPMRHETLVIQRDIARWHERCRPVLAIDFHAPGACESDGAYAYLPKPDEFPQQHEATREWTDAVEASLTREFAAGEFGRTANYASRWETPTFTSFMSSLGVPAFTLETPYALCGDTVLTRELYRQIGRRLVDGVMGVLNSR